MDILVPVEQLDYLRKGCHHDSECIVGEPDIEQIIAGTQVKQPTLP